MDDRAKQLIKEQEAQSAVEAKIRTMQSKLLSGDGNLLDQTRQQQEMLKQKRIELAEQKVNFLFIFFIFWHFRTDICGLKF